MMIDIFFFICYIGSDYTIKKGLGFMRNKLGTVLWGLALIAVGIGLAGNVFGIWNFELFFDGWWTLFIIVPCVISMIQTGFNTGNVAGVLVGLVLLLSCQGVVDGDKMWKLIVPVILIVLGVKIIFKRPKQPAAIPEGYSKMANGKNKRRYSAVFSEGRYMVDSAEEFDGCSINAVFGGYTLDLRGARITRDVLIEINALFGGVNIMLPMNVKAEVTSNPILGGVNNKFIDNAESNAPTVYIRAEAVCGGAEIR